MLNVSTVDINFQNIYTHVILNLVLIQFNITLQNTTKEHGTKLFYIDTTF